MLKLIFALIPLATSLTGQQPTPLPPPAVSNEASVKPQAKPSTKAAPSSGIQGIPAGAVKIDETTYRYQEVDAKGKKGKVYLYRRNPFGVSRMEEPVGGVSASNASATMAFPGSAAMAGATAVPPVPQAPVTVTDLGDSYRFERPGPFGMSGWTRKKTELSSEEQSLVEKSKSAVLSTRKEEY